MFAKLSLLALALVLPLISALTIDAPTDAVSTNSSIVKFSGNGDEPVFTIELAHPSLLSRIALANNVNPGDGSIKLVWPVLLQTDGYTLEAVNIGNISQVYATSAPFTIAAAPLFTSSGTPSSLPSQTGTATNPPSLPATSGTTPAGTTHAPSGTSGSQTQTGPGSSTSAPPTQINGNNGNGAFSLKSNVGAVALVAVGAAFFAL